MPTILEPEEDLKAGLEPGGLLGDREPRNRHFGGSAAHIYAMAAVESAAEGHADVREIRKRGLKLGGVLAAVYIEPLIPSQWNRIHEYALLERDENVRPPAIPFRGAARLPVVALALKKKTDRG